MTYNEALEFIWGTPSPSNKRVINLKHLLQELGNPQKDMKYVHIAGTNGKGSTSAMVSEMLRCAGYKTGLYTSPHLHTINERFQIDGEPISDTEFAEITTLVAQAVERIAAKGHTRPTIYGLITAVGYIYFKRHTCDIVVLEVGMGGRLDATNVIDSAEVSAITSIGFDHTEFLGGTLGDIAAEKAGIIKKGGSVVCYCQSKEVEDVIARKCREENATLRFADGLQAVVKSLTLEGSVFDYGKYTDLKISLMGLYQVKNAVTAIEIVEVLINKGWNIDQACIRQGLNRARWPGRLELINKNPTVIADGTHNPQGAMAMLESLMALFGDRKLIFIMGFLADKDYSGSIELVLPYAKRFYAVAPDSERALTADKLANEIMHHSSPVNVVTCSDMPEALQAAIREASEDDIICVFGSLYQISEVHSFFRRD